MPAASPDFEPLGSVGGGVVAVILILAAAYGCGRMILRRPRRGSISLEAALLSIAGGITLLGWLTITMGLSGWLSRSVSISVVTLFGSIGAVIFAIDLIHWRCRLLGSIPTPTYQPKASADKHLLGHKRRRSVGRRAHASDSEVQPTSQPRQIAAVSLTLLAIAAAVVTLGPALCYPTGWDELVYHHELPKRWLADGWPAVYRDLPYSGFPSLGELLFWLMAPLDGVIAPRLLMWAVWLIALASVYRLLRRHLRQNSAAVLTAAFAMSGAVLLISANCYVECLLLLDTAALLLALKTRSQAPVWERTSPRLLPRVPPYSQAILIGILAGGAAGVKLHGLAIALLPGVWYALQLVTRRLRARGAALAIAVYLLTAACTAFPFYLRPWLETGNPFYPYYAQWFTTDTATLEMSRFHHGLGAAFGVHTPEALFTGPILLAFSADVYDGTFGYQLLLVLVLAIPAFIRLRPAHTDPTRQRGSSAKRSSRFRNPLPLVIWPALVAASLYVFWFFTAQQARFAIPAAVGLLMLAAYGLRQIHGTRRNWILAALMAAAALSLPYRNVGYYFGSWLAALGVITPSDYVTVNTGGADPTDQEYVPLIKALQEHLPPDARLLILFEHRVFYVPCASEIGTPFFQEAHFTPPEDFSTPERILAHLAECKITHLLLPNAPAGPDRLTDEWFDRLEHFLPCFGQLTQQGKLQTVWQSNRYLLLIVNPAPAPNPALLPEP